MSDSVFEIREYLDSEGKVNSHDVTDISKELEYMEKLVNSMQEQPCALNEEDQFIRELALLSQEKSLDDETVGDDFFETFEARESSPAPMPVKKAPAVTKKASGEKQKSGWGKGFLTQSQPAPKVAKSSSADGLAASTQKMSIDDNSKDNTSSTSIAYTAPETVFTAPAPLKGILKHTTPTTPTTTTTTSTPNTTTTPTPPTPTAPTNTTTPTNTTAEPANSAFSGSIMERAPTKTVAKLGTGSKGVILGGPRKNV